jgi:hypothetical protein
MLNRIFRIAAFQNPEFYKAQAMRLSTWDKPRVISCGEEFTQYLAVPRGCLQEISDLLKEHQIKVAARDERFQGKRFKWAFKEIFVTTKRWQFVKCLGTTMAYYARPPLSARP